MNEQDVTRSLWFMFFTLVFLALSFIILVMIPFYTYFKVFFFMLGAE